MKDYPQINRKEKQNKILVNEERMRVLANLLIDRVLEEKGRDRTMQIQGKEHFTVISNNTQQVSWGGKNHA